MNTRIFVRAGILLAFSAATSLSLAQTLDPNPQGQTHGPPSVRIATPQDAEAFLLGHNINICALTLNFTDAVAQVQFFAGTNSLGVVTNNHVLWGGQPTGPCPEEYACITWSNAATGAYTLTAKATDLAGITVTSPPVDITVVTDLPPVVRIVSPPPTAHLSLDPPTSLCVPRPSIRTGRWSPCSFSRAPTASAW